MLRASVLGAPPQDLLIEGERIARIEPAGRLLAEQLAERTIDLAGYVLLPAAAEPHAHLDKALLGARVSNLTEDLPGAVEAIISAYPSMDEADVEARATEALRQAVAHGFTAIRTHVDCRSGVGARNVAVLARLRDRLRPFVDLQIVALAGPLSGLDRDRERALLVESMRGGADLVGGAPAIDPDPEGSMRELVAVAAEFGVGLDVHVDETLDARSSVLRSMAEHVIATGFPHPVTASHCVSLSAKEPAEIERTVELVAAAGISVVALPQTNLYLQGREASGSVPRALPPIAALVRAGVTVAAGGDNWRDPFNPMGRIDPLETASLLVAAGHELVQDACDRVTVLPRRIMGLEPAAIEVGALASMCAVRGDSLADAVGRGSEDRIVFSRGSVIARTEVVTAFSAGFPLAADLPLA